MLTVQQMKPDQDLSEQAVLEACAIAGCPMPEDAAVYTSFECMPTALLIKRNLRCQVHILPKEFITGGADAWAVRVGDTWIWSPGA
jgi:hypothetical protein